MKNQMVTHSKKDDDTLRPLKVLFSREYSTQKAITMFHGMHADGIQDEYDADEIGAMLSECEDEDPQFFIEAVDWREVRQALNLFNVNRYLPR